jgi:uncharacterized repeat protein (TIGR03806 family)
MRIFLLVLLVSIVSCKPVETKPQVTLFERGAFPANLRDWGLLYQSGDELVVNDRVIPYDLKSALFSDFAYKFRTVYVPEGKQGTSEGEIDLPIGSILSKTFYYPRGSGGLQVQGFDGIGDHGLKLSQVELIETRLLVHLDEGWVGLPYVWNESGTEATLEIAGADRELTVQTSYGPKTFSYVVPDFNQCQGCHIENLTEGEMAPVGFKFRHLDKPYEHFHQAKNQLTYFVSLDFLDSRPAGHFPTSVDWQDESASLDDRARSYLDINCGHCHNPAGPADTSGMFLTRETTEVLRLGVCKPPVAAGQGTGGRPVGIHPGYPENSILTYRMSSEDLGAMMPELGRSLVHEAGVELVSDWITAMEGDC